MKKTFCPIGAITDEFHPDCQEAMIGMASIGMDFAELRMINDKNILELTDTEVGEVINIARSEGLGIISIAAPIFKCVLPGVSEVDNRWTQDVFGLPYKIGDQVRLKRRALEIAKRTGAQFIRVFSGVRTIDPMACFPYVKEMLEEFANEAEPLGLTIALETEHTCNVATASEAAILLSSLPSQNVGLVWDPANALVAGEEPYPFGYEKLKKNRIVHVHAKDCIPQGTKANWCSLGLGDVNWTGQMRALKRDNYQGAISLETHWPGPDLGGKDENKWSASLICGNMLRVLASNL